MRALTGLAASVALQLHDEHGLPKEAALCEAPVRPGQHHTAVLFSTGARALSLQHEWFLAGCLAIAPQEDDRGQAQIRHQF